MLESARLESAIPVAVARELEMTVPLGGSARAERLTKLPAGHASHGVLQEARPNENYKSAEVEF